MNKTQKELISRLINRGHFLGSIKQGWTITQPINNTNIFMSLQKLNEGQQAHNLAEKYPDIFKAEQRAWRLVILFLLDETKARNLANKIGGI